MSDDATTPTGDGDRPAQGDEPDDRYAIRIRSLQHYFGEGTLRKQVLFDNNLESPPARS